MVIYPNAKINIGLNIIAKRPDGFHEIESLMYPIPLRDEISVAKAEAGGEKFSFAQTGIRIDGDVKDNLVYKAYALLDKDFSLPPVRVEMQKIIPFGGGLGGGSADCSFTLLALSQLCDLGLSESALEVYAGRLGSDCPFFVQNKPAIARGRGELLHPFPINLQGKFIVLVVPPVHVSTPVAYSRVKPQKPSFHLEEQLAKPMETWKETLKNDFEASVYAYYPQIADVKERLYQAGAVYASLSGSGASTYGLFDAPPVGVENLFADDHFVWSSWL